MKTLFALLALSSLAFAQKVTIGPCSLSSGLSDVTISGTYNVAPVNAQYQFTVTTAGTPDQFTWSKNGGAASSPVAITGGNQAFVDGLSVKFAATTGHTAGAVCTVIVTANGSVAGQSFVQTGVGASVSRSVQDVLRERASTPQDFGARGVPFYDDGALAKWGAGTSRRTAMIPAGDYACNNPAQTAPIAIDMGVLHAEGARLLGCQLTTAGATGPVKIYGLTADTTAYTCGPPCPVAGGPILQISSDHVSVIDARFAFAKNYTAIQIGSATQCPEDVNIDGLVTTTFQSHVTVTCLAGDLRINSLTMNGAGGEDGIAIMGLSGATTGVALSNVTATNVYDILKIVNAVYPISGVSLTNWTCTNCVAPIYLQGLYGYQYWAASHSYAVNDEFVDAANHIQKVTVAGISGTIIPANDAGGSTSDGTAVITDQGPGSPGSVMGINVSHGEEVDLTGTHMVNTVFWTSVGVPFAGVSISDIQARGRFNATTGQQSWVRMILQGSATVSDLSILESNFATTPAGTGSTPGNVIYAQSDGGVNSRWKIAGVTSNGSDFPCIQLPSVAFGSREDLVIEDNHLSGCYGALGGAAVAVNNRVDFAPGQIALNPGQQELTSFNTNYPVGASFNELTGTGLAPWAPLHPYPLNGTIVDGSGHAQKVTTAGTSGVSAPTFSTIGGTASDGSVVWTDQGVNQIGACSAAITAVCNSPAAPFTGQEVVISGATGSWSPLNGVWYAVANGVGSWYPTRGLQGLVSTGFGALTGTVTVTPVSVADDFSGASGGTHSPCFDCLPTTPISQNLQFPGGAMCTMPNYVGAVWECGYATPPLPLSTFGACSALRAGETHWIGDATTVTLGAAVAGGGTSLAGVGCDGINWRVVTAMGAPVVSINGATGALSGANSSDTFVTGCTTTTGSACANSACTSTITVVTGVSCPTSTKTYLNGLHQ